MEQDIIEKELKQEEKVEIKGKEITSSAKKALIWFLLINLVLSGAIYYLAATHENSNISDKDQVLLFFSPTCPHCKNVEDFIQNNRLDSKINITMKNTWIPEIATEYTQIADLCKIAKESRGVPMLYYNQTCYLGDIDSIKTLKKIGGLD